jgi:FAD/FMN-containing dehydrogenase
VLGIEAVVADEDATVLDLLTTLRKDNSRLALHQLFVGSSGALGVITKVAVELAPLPAARATWWIVPSSDDAVPRLLAHVEREAGPALTAFELLSAGAFAATGSALFAPPPDTVLLVELSGDECVDELFERVLAGVPDGVMIDARSVPAATSWAIRHAVSEALRRQGEVVGLDVSAPRSEVLALRAEARQMVAARFPGGVLCEFGHMGDGSLHLNVVFAGGATDGDKDRLRAAIHDLVRGHHGSFSAEHGIGPFNADQWRASTPPAVQRATAQLVRLFDPRGVLGHPGLPFRDEVTSP